MMPGLASTCPWEMGLVLLGEMAGTSAGDLEKRKTENDDLVLLFFWFLNFGLY